MSGCPLKYHMVAIFNQNNVKYITECVAICPSFMYLQVSQTEDVCVEMCDSFTYFEDGNMQKVCTDQCKDEYKFTILTNVSNSILNHCVSVC